MVVFYRGPCSRITHEVFETWCPTYRRFLLNDLRNPCVAEQPVDPPAAVATIRTVSTAMAGATAATVALGWTEGWHVLESPAVAVVVLAMLIASVIVSGVCWRVRPVQWELAATYRGGAVTLFHSTDASEFEQVRRGLLRALDQLDETR